MSPRKPPKPLFTGGPTAPDRLEYRVPGAVFDALGNRTAHAVCYPDTEGLLGGMAYTLVTTRVRTRSADHGRQVGVSDTFQAKLEKRALAASKIMNVAEAWQQQARTDVAVLRMNGTQGPIPVCLFRSTGKLGEGTREKRRSTAEHERFHAWVRRQEYGAGLSPNALSNRKCGEAVKAMVRDGAVAGGVEGDPAAIGGLSWANRKLRWADAGSYDLYEEILARTQEIERACQRSDTDCGEAAGRFKTQLELAGASDVDAILKIATGLKSIHGSTKGAIHAAIRACAGRAPAAP